MDVQAAILTAIADRPADDTPRLAYADWLDDHAGDLPDPAAARVRAEFIRVQCEVKRLEHLPSALLQGYAELYRRQDHILTHHRRDLLGPLADALGPHDAVFDRGFVSELGLDAEALYGHSAEISALVPRPDVAVTYPAAGDAVRASPVLDLVTTARWQSLPEEATHYTWWIPDGVAWLRARVLILAGAGVTDIGMANLVGRPAFPALTDVDLSWNAVTDECVSWLIKSGLWRRLRVLVLTGNPISDEGANALADAPPTALQYLNVARTGITRHGQQKLLRRKGWKVDLF